MNALYFFLGLKVFAQRFAADGQFPAKRDAFFYSPYIIHTGILLVDIWYILGCCPGTLQQYENIDHFLKKGPLPPLSSLNQSLGTTEGPHNQWSLSVYLHLCSLEDK